MNKTFNAKTAGFVIGCLLLFGTELGVRAASDPPRQYTLAESGVVIFAKVDSVKDGKMAVSILEIWKGKPPVSLILTLEPAMEDLKPNARCVLCRVENLTDKNTVAESFFFGDVDWICMPVGSEAEKKQMKAWALGKK